MFIAWQCRSIPGFFPRHLVNWGHRAQLALRSSKEGTGYVVQRNRKMVEDLGWHTERVNNTEKKELDRRFRSLSAFFACITASPRLSRTRIGLKPLSCSAAPPVTHVVC